MAVLELTPTMPAHQHAIACSNCHEQLQVPDCCVELAVLEHYLPDVRDQDSKHVV